MGRTARRVLGAGALAVLVALTAVPVVASASAGDALIKPSPAQHASLRVPVEAKVQPAEPVADRDTWSWRGFVELLVLAVACAAVVAYYSESAGQRGGTRVPARVRRR